MPLQRQKLIIAAIVGFGALLVWLALYWTPDAGPLPHRGPSVLEQVPKGGDFVLASADGPVGLKDYRGKIVLLYFGYTFCPDVCPTSLSLMAQALSSLDVPTREKVRGIFISVDPERDSKERLKEYAPFFDPLIIGASGTPDQIAAVARLYGASYMKQKPNADGQYVVDHSSVTYVIAPDGTLAAQLPHGSPPQAIVAEISRLLPAAR